MPRLAKMNAKEQAMFDHLSALSSKALEKELRKAIPFDPDTNTGIVMENLFRTGAVKQLKDEGW